MSGFMSHPLGRQKTIIWSTDQEISSVSAAEHRRKSLATPEKGERSPEDVEPAPKAGGRRGSVSFAGAAAAGKAARRSSIQPVRRGDLSAAEHDSIILDHVTGVRDAFEDSTALMLDETLKATLADVQRHSPFFQDFADEEINALFTCLTLFPFKNGDCLAIKGEPASWCGILLTGQIEPTDEETGQKHPMLTPGAMVGEMSLFRGGVRYCDMIGRGNGALAALLYEDLAELYTKVPTIAHKLIAAFGKSAASKLVHLNPLPSGPPLPSHPLFSAVNSSSPSSQRAGGIQRSKTSELTSADPAVRLKVISSALQSRGLDEDDSLELLKALTVEEYQPNQTIYAESKRVQHVGIVLSGSVTEGELTKGAGDMVGAWFALSGHPVHMRVCGGPSGATLGCLTLDKIGEIAATNGMLALKALKLIGLSATAQAEEKGDDDENMQASLGSKLTEVLYRNKIKDVEAKAKVQEEQATLALHEKQRNAMLLKKVQKAHAEATVNLQKTKDELQGTKNERDALKKQMSKRDADIVALNTKIDSLMRQIELERAGAGESEMTKEMNMLRDISAEKDRQLGKLKEENESCLKEMDDQLEAFKTEYRKLQTESMKLHEKTVTQFRWRVFILLILLDKKRRFERKMKVKSKVVEWISGSNKKEAEISLAMVRDELFDAQRELTKMSKEGEELRVAANTIADAKRHLEQQQAALVQTAKEALGRDNKLDDVAKAAEERAIAAAQRTESLVSEGLHLKWAVREAEERVREGASECAKLVAERDAAMNELMESRKGEEEAMSDCAVAKKRIFELEAMLLAERADFGARIADNEHKAREGAAAMQRVRKLEHEIDAANAARAADSLLHEKQRILLSRLIELEGTFGEMLAPPGGPTAYGQALQELTKKEISIQPAKRLIENASNTLDVHLVPSPLKGLPLPGKEAMHAASVAAKSTLGPATASASAGVLTDPTAASAIGRAAGVGRVDPTGAPAPAMTGSASLPMLRNPAGLTSERPLPVARGAARAQARRAQGVSVGSRNSELKQLVAMQNRTRANLSPPFMASPGRSPGR